MIVDINRKCEVTGKDWDHGKGTWVSVEPKTATFHQWGCRYEEFDNGAGNETVGVVEFEDGQCGTFLPSQIKFIQEEN